MMEGQALNETMNAIQTKPQVEFNSQGIAVEKQEQLVPQQEDLADDDVVPLWDTPLAQGLNDLMPATDDTGMEHKIISCGHVLKSTHDLARWSEKTGALRVNTQEAFDSVSDITISLEAPVRRNNGNLNHNNSNNNTSNGNRNSNTSSNNTNNTNNANRRRVARRSPGSNGQHWQQKNEAFPRSQLPQMRSQGSQARSQVLSCGPILKSTHDLATPAEKRGAVNDSGSLMALDESASVAKGALRGVQAGGSALGSGLDTQAGSHVQLDSQKVKESPEQVMQNLSTHV